ncbi:VOC family protein [Urbifossiella limnaea]|uniref:Glyoxalase-like domain protein n=1 Tax=Urbifossiella limnaea TaxID=2528023 RepID=A0A517XRM8_9BACT|nr:VOC family protein [Urbifossiella limnaea]QDU20159.1 Glyoxalase-like domain protein [Urbifossiella limnaea]
MPTLFMVELAVADAAASRRWYEVTLGMKVVTVDASTGFALLQDERGGRLALKPGTPNPGGVTLHFEVADVAAAIRGLRPDGPAVVSPEGYREAFVRDPDGYRVGLFAWT